MVSIPIMTYKESGRINKNPQFLSEPSENCCCRLTCHKNRRSRPAKYKERFLKGWEMVYIDSSDPV